MTKQYKIVVFVSLTITILSFFSILILSIPQKSSELAPGHTIASGIRIAVLNGCGREGLASIFADRLRNIGYDVVNGQGGNADSFDFEISVVVARKGNIEDAETVAKDLGIHEIVDQYSANPYIIEDILVILVGVLVPIKFLISFELLLAFAAPGILLLLILNSWRYYKFKSQMDLALIGTWLGLGLAIGAYFLYFILGITQRLWAQGIWFSDNDVLHIGLILWMLYIALSAANKVGDLPAA